MSKNTRNLCFSAVAILTLAISGCAAPVDLTDSASEAQSSLPKVSANKEAIELLPADVADSREVTFAGVAGLPPMMYVEKDGTTLGGVEYDILQSVGDALDLKVNMVSTKPDAFLTGLLADRFQGAAGSITVTAERQAKVDFVAYAEYGQALMTRTEDAEELDSKAICGHPVGVLQGSVQQSAILPKMSKQCQENNQEALTEIAFPDGSALTLALTSGRIDGALLNEVTLADLTSKSNGELRIAESLDNFGKDLKGFALQKDTGLSKAVDAALRSMAEKGELEQIFDKWEISEAMTDPQLNPVVKGR